MGFLDKFKKKATETVDKHIPDDRPLGPPPSS
jgi:hypothetical protein